MAPCCRCNGAGKCVSCVCSRSDRQCTNCLPSKRGRCLNIERDSAPLGAPTDRHLHVPADQEHSHSSISPDPVTVVSTLVHNVTVSTDDSTPGPGLGLQVPEATPPTPIGAHLLPEPVPMADPSFVWGQLDAATFIHSVTSAYAEVIHWRQNIFTVPYGKAGKMFVSELSRLFRSYAEGSALEPIALKAATVMSVLVLQTPAPKGKSKELSTCLERRLNSWTEGDINSFILEGRQLQNQLPQWKIHRKSTAEKEGTACSFANLMFKGKTEAALKLLSQKGRGRVLQATQLVDITNPNSPTVLDPLKSKHPPAQPAISNALPPESPEPPQIHPVIFNSINASTIRSSALVTKGSAGPSSLEKAMHLLQIRLARLMPLPRTSI